MVQKWFRNHRHCGPEACGASGALPCPHSRETREGGGDQNALGTCPGQQASHTRCGGTSGAGLSPSVVFFLLLLINKIKLGEAPPLGLLSSAR